MRAFSLYIDSNVFARKKRTLLLARVSFASEFSTGRMKSNYPTTSIAAFLPGRASFPFSSPWKSVSSSILARRRRSRLSFRKMNAEA